MATHCAYKRKNVGRCCQNPLKHHTKRDEYTRPFSFIKIAGVKSPAIFYPRLKRAKNSFVFSFWGVSKI